MHALSRSSPFFKSLLAIGTISLAIWCHALTTDTIVLLPSWSPPGRVVKKSDKAGEYRFLMLYSCTVGVACVFISLVRINPFEDRLATWKSAIKARAEVSSATTKPAPVWAYFFLAAFVAFIAYLGYILMYNE